MANRIVYAICSDDCKFETMTKEDILAAIQQAIEQGYVSEPDAAVFSKIKEIHANGTTQIWVGTESEFNALSKKPTIHKSVVRVGTDGVLYLCTDDSTIHDVVPVEGGGTGATNAATARANLGITPETIGAATSGHGHALTDSKISGVLPVTKGGTGATTAATARSNLGITPANIGALATTGGTVKGSILLNDNAEWVGYRLKRTINNVSHYVDLAISGVGNTEIAAKQGNTTTNYMSLQMEQTTFGKPVAVASGGTGATTAADARKNLGFTFSTSEQATGDTWVDGKPIYRVAVPINVTTAGNMVIIKTFAAAVNVINFSGYVIRGGGVYRFPVNWYGGASNYHSIWMETETKLVAATTAALAGYVIVEYTK